MHDDLDQLRGRFEALADGDGEGPIPGADDVARGLQALSTHLRDRHRTGNGDQPSPDHTVDEQRLALIIQGLRGLADLLTPGDDSSDHGAKTDSDAGVEQFIATFRSEAEKRLQGLSISLMSVFGQQEGQEALEQSTDHLHAIRGSAAMLGLDDVAELAEAMEHALVCEANKAPEQRDWPTKTLLRGYALLEDAIDSDPPAVDADFSGAILDGLRHASQSPSPDVSRETPPGAASNTDVDSDADSDVDSDADSDAPRDATDSQASPTSADDRCLEQPILIVDDVDTIAASVGFILSELEVPIEIASNGEEAMQMLKDTPFSLVISDVDMPRMDGIALTRMIRASDDLSQLPVILLTSLDHPEERQAGMEAGATDYIIKGAIGGGELLRRVRDLLQVAPKVARKKEVTKRRILIAEDTETVAASIAFVLSEGPFEIILTGNGKEALKRLHAEPFDLLITDMQMPYMDGTELVRQLREDDELVELPVVMLTSVDDDEMIAQALDAGIDRYLLKGEVAGGKLLTIVEELLP